MSVTALKEEAIRQFAIKVASVDDEAELQVILDFLSGIHPNDKQGLNLSRHYEKIKARYGDVLKKLAE